MKIVVVGAGFGGLAAGIRLQAQGHRVTIVEKLDRPGGRASVFRQDGFTFDAGPTIITAPWMLQELFTAAGERLEETLELVRLDPLYNVRFPDGKVFSCRDNEDALEEAVRRFDAGDVAGYRRFSSAADAAFRRAMPLIDRPFLTLGSMLRVLPDLVRVRADRSVAALAGRCFRNPQLQQVFSFHPLLIGGNPFTTPSLYALIHALEKRWGVWFARGGMGAVVRELARLFRDLGGELLLRREVSGIAVERGRVAGVTLTSGQRITAGAVVANGDIATTHARLLPASAGARTRRRLRRMQHSMSVFVLYFGTSRRYEHMAHHEIIMGPRYREHLQEIFSGAPLAEDFSLYLHRPTASDPSLAPNGCDAWYALAPVPNLAAGIDWEREGPRLRDRIVRHLQAHYLPELSRHIVTERAIDPRYFRDTLNSHLGAAFSFTPRLTQSAWFRPHNASGDVDSLYFVGAGTHPGAGVPGVLSSAKIVADLIGTSLDGDSGGAIQPSRQRALRGQPAYS